MSDITGKEYIYGLAQDKNGAPYLFNVGELVRCKDCKYSFYDKDYENYNCRKHEYVECFDADDYCSWGERND